jgi:hypothetical protein
VLKIDDTDSTSFTYSSETMSYTNEKVVVAVRHVQRRNLRYKATNRHS